MRLDWYQQEAVKTAHYDKVKWRVLYPALGLGGESGEVLDKIKKVIRDGTGEPNSEEIRSLMLEMGDVLWYLANMADDLGFTLEEVAKSNLEKLWDRQERGKIGGSGDNR